MQYIEGKVSGVNWKPYYSRVHGQIHLAAQFTSGVLWHFQNAPWNVGFLVLKGQKWDLAVTPKLKIREVSQIGFWNILSYPTSVPSLSQIGWPQLLAPGTLSHTIALVTLQTFYLGKHDLLTVYLGKLDFLSVTDFPQVTYLGKILSSGSWICLENNRVSLDSYPKAIAREKWNTEVASQ